MTETTMAPVKIALDHGWSSIKGEHTFMETSIVPVDYEPLTKNGLLEYKGRKYIVGQGRLGKQATKTENENYFLLTLAGIAKELQYQGKTAASYVELYAGVPLTLFGAERKEFRDYLWHKERISFTFEGVHYSFFMDKVKIYAQCYAAIANRMGDMDRLRCVDLGSWTLDILSVRDRIPMDKDACTYELGLITTIERIKKDALPKLKCEIPEDDIVDVIRGKQSNINADFIPFIEKGLQQYADEVEAKLREIKVDLLAKKHTDNYWVEKRLMNQNAKDGVGITSNRELIRDTIDKLLPFVDSLEQLVECLQFMYNWKIRVTNKTVTFSTSDMKQGIRGNKLGEGYGKAELVERITKVVAERNAEKEARRIAEEKQE